MTTDLKLKHLPVCAYASYDNYTFRLESLEVDEKGYQKVRSIMFQKLNKNAVVYYPLYPLFPTLGYLPIGTVVRHPDEPLELRVDKTSRGSHEYVVCIDSKGGTWPFHKSSIIEVISYPNMPIGALNRMPVSKIPALEDPNAKSCDVCYTLRKPGNNCCHQCGARY